MAMLYAGINLFCMLILFLLLIEHVTDPIMQKSRSLFIFVLISAIIFIASDLCWGLMMTDFWTPSIAGCYIVNAVYHTFTGVMAFSWFNYSEYVQGSVFSTNRNYKYLSCIPLIVLIVLAVSAYGNHFLFYIDENFVYHRGIFYFIQPILSFSYPLFTSVNALIKALDVENYADRRQHIILASFILFPFLFAALQIFLEGVPVICMGITLGALQVYIHSAKLMISLDPLTQLNNRNQLVKHLNRKFKSGEKNNFYLVIMDIDNFKKINDRHGHVEGDNAIMFVASVLRTVCGKTDCFVSRYGGDEFIIVCDGKSATDIEGICEEIHTELLNTNNGAPYSITLSMGFAQCSEDIKSIPQLIALADAELYKTKLSKKSQQVHA